MEREMGVAVKRRIIPQCSADGLRPARLLLDQGIAEFNQEISSNTGGMMAWRTAKRLIKNEIEQLLAK